MSEAITGSNKATVLFDASCKLCNNVVGFITRHDIKKRFCFLPLESEKAKEYLKLHNWRAAEKGAMMLFADGKVYVKSDAVFRILRFLDGLWPLFYAFLIIPRFIRDPIYNIISKYRYRWFGPCTDCPEYKPCV